jgi:hypothetical protein
MCVVCPLRSWLPRVAGSFSFHLFSGQAMQKARVLVAAMLFAGLFGCGSPTGQGINRDKDKPVPAGRPPDNQQAQ